MGFLDGFLKQVEIKEVIDLYHGLHDDDEEDYREIALDNTPSNRGWYTCPKCGKKFRASEMDADHIVPRSKGGDNSRYNLQMLCVHCNRSKQDSTSDTKKDLKRRKKELKKQDKEDLEYFMEASRSFLYNSSIGNSKKEG